MAAASITRESTTTYYETLTKAIDSCQLNVVSPTEIKMLKNIKENIVIQNTQNIILNTNEKTLTNNNSNTITNNGKLEIIGTGTISSGSDYIAINNTGTESVTINNTVIIGEYGIYSNSGSVIITGGSISGITNGIYTDSAEVIFNEGNIIGLDERGIGIKTVSGNITINGGVITSDNNTAVYTTSGIVNVTSGKIKGGTHGIYNETGVVTIGTLGGRSKY